jgi:hypothetical protein
LLVPLLSRARHDLVAPRLERRRGHKVDIDATGCNDGPTENLIRRDFESLYELYAAYSMCTRYGDRASEDSCRLALIRG